MRVLYVSKALVVAAYRDKTRELGRRVELSCVVPERWGPADVESSPPGLPEPRRVPVALDGHNHLHFYPAADRWLAEERPDLVHIDEEPYSLVTWQLARICKGLRIPCLFFAWQNLPRRLPPPFGSFRARVFRSARGGLAGTESAASVLRGWGFQGPLEVIPQFGVDPERFRPDGDARRRVRARLGIPCEAFVVGFGGRLLPEKGVHLLVKAVELLAAKGSGAPPWLMVMGDGPERGVLEALAGRLGVRPRARFTGHLPSTEVPGALAALDVLALPSLPTRTWTEQFGRILVEAMAVGVPVVGSRSGEIPEVLGDAGEVVEPGDAHDLARALGRLIEDEGLRRQRAEKGRARVLCRFTQAGVAERTVAFYRDLLGAGGAA